MTQNNDNIDVFKPTNAMREALVMAKKALSHAVPWVEAGPAGSWQDGVLTEISAALAAIREAEPLHLR